VALSVVRRLLAHRGARSGIGLGLLLLNLVLVNYIAAWHYTRSDWTADQIYSLSPRTIEALRGLPRPVRATVFMVPPDRMPGSLLPEIRELMLRFARHTGRVQVQYVDPDLDPTRADLLAAELRVSRSDLLEGGVALSSGGRSRFVPAAAMAEHALQGGTQRVLVFRGEAALLEALISVTSRGTPVACFTSGHGEASTDSYAEAGYGHIADAVRREGFQIKTLDAASLEGGLRGCNVTVIGGPHVAFATPEQEALDRYLRQGGRLFVLLGPVLDRRVTTHGRVGLESLLGRWGVRVMENIVVDPLAVPGEQPLMTWATREGYGDHPVGRALSGRITVWPLTREVRPGPARRGFTVKTLVRTSEKGWAETDLASLRGERPLRLDRAVDTPGPVSVAVAGSCPGRPGPRCARLVVFGTERGVLNRRLGRETVRDYNEDLFLAALGWLAGAGDRVAVGPKVPERLQLTLDDRQLARVFLISVVGLPGAAFLVGVLVWWRRRR